MRLVINRCPEHRSFWSISVDGEDFGERVTGSKCCGQWRVVRDWTLSPREWARLAEIATEASKQVPAMDPRLSRDAE